MREHFEKVSAFGSKEMQDEIRKFGSRLCALCVLCVHTDFCSVCSVCCVLLAGYWH